MRETYKVVGLVQHKQLGEVLRVLEERKIPYNVELHVDEAIKKPRKNGGTTGADFILGLLKKSPMNGQQLKEAFKTDGRSGASISSVLQKLRVEKLVTYKKGTGYMLRRSTK